MSLSAITPSLEAPRVPRIHLSTAPIIPAPSADRRLWDPS
jgi:hypothetical protein